MSALFAAWSSGKSINVVAFPVLIMLGSEVIVLEILDPADHLPLEVLKTHEPG
jgi:hypothetical protein